MEPFSAYNASKPASPRRRRGYYKWIAIATVIIALIAIALPVAALKYGESQSFGKMTPETRAAFDKWYTQKLAVPAEAIALEPFSPEVLAALGNFYEQWEYHKAAVLEIDQSWPCDATAGAIDNFVEQNLDKPERFQSLLAAFKTLTSTPGYSLDLWMNETFTVQSRFNRWLPFRAAMRLLQIESTAKLRAGSTNAAIESAEVLIQASRHHTYDSIFIHSMSVATMNSGLSAFQNILGSSSNSSDSSRIATTLSRHRGILTALPDAILPWTVDHIGMTTNARRAGLTPDFDNKTGCEVMKESLHIQQKYYESVVLPGATVAAEKEAAEMVLATCNAQTDLLNPQHNAWPKVFGKKFERIHAATMFAIAAPAMGKQLQSKKAVHEKYNQLLASLTTPPPA